MQADQAGDDLEVVLDAMMHLSRQFTLGFQPLGHLGLMRCDILADFAEGFAQRHYFLRGSAYAAHGLQHFAGMIGGYGAAQRD